jgi:hypothetical protein
VPPAPLLLLLFCSSHSLRCCRRSCCLHLRLLLSAVFTLFTSIALWLDGRFTANAGGSEAFSTAGRAVKAGLTACDIVSEFP